MMKKAFYIYLTLIYSFSLSSQDRVENVLTKQLIHGASQYFYEAGVEIPKKEFDNEELVACVETVENILKSNGYKVLSVEEFNSKIKKIFNRIIENNSGNKYLYIDYLNQCNRSFNNNPNNRLEYYGTYIIKDKKFITDFYYLPQIIDYKTKYPEVAKIEHEIPLKYKDNDGDYYSIETWDMLSKNKNKEYNLTNERYINIQTLINRNKYLFNDNRASFPWLITNDKFFMESLVKTFGYTEDEKLLEWVIKNNPMPNERYTNLPSMNSEWRWLTNEFGKILWNKKCNEEISINFNSFKILHKHINSKNTNHNLAPLLIRNIYNYMNYFTDENELDLNDKQKSKILAHLLHFLHQYSLNPEYQNLYISTVGATELKNAILNSFVAYEYEYNYLKEFEKNDYYNLPNFKDWIEQAIKSKYNPDSEYE